MPSSSSVMTLETRSSLFTRVALAATYRLYHSSKYFCVRPFWAMTSVRSPSMARFSQDSSIVALYPGLTVAFITVSAPFK